MRTATELSTGPIVLLGPQSDYVEVGAVLDELEVDGRVALVTAGWQENETEDAALAGQVRRPTINLALHARSERAHLEQPDFAKASAQRQAHLMHLHQFYRIRLEGVDEAAHAIGVRHVDAELLREQQSVTVEQFRHLDQDHLQRCQAAWSKFDAQWPAAEQPAIARERASIAAQIARCSAVVIAGGHVAVLLNRLRLFDVLSNLGTRPVIAWSAGAMALSDRIVLFHDSPPFGKNLSQLFDVGLGLANGVVVLPDLTRRVHTEKCDAVARFTQRMAPAECLGMDPGARLVFRQGRLRQALAHRLRSSGDVERGWRLILELPVDRASRPQGPETRLQG